jgi:hypothetical protein
MSEGIIHTPPSQESIRLERFTRAHELVAEIINEELQQRHKDKTYHNPEHTLGIEGATQPDGVVPSVSYLSGLLRTHFADSLALDTAEGEESFVVVERALEAGARVHDIIIELDGVTEAGMVIRRRGWQEGGNERESYLRYRQLFIETYLEETELSPESVEYHHQALLVEDTEYGRYMQSVEHTVAGTDPDATAFGVEVPASYVQSASPQVAAALLDSMGVARYLRLDSTKTNQSLESLLASTADLMSASYPERYFVTGNGEFFELHVGIAKDCEHFLSEGGINRDRAKTILASMQGWRKVQVGFAVGQKIRLDKNYTIENITRLFAETFNVTPEVREVRAFIESVLPMGKLMLVSAEESAQRLEEFVSNFKIPNGKHDLTATEQDLFRRAIEAMGGEQSVLARYVSHVEATVGQSV